MGLSTAWLWHRGVSTFVEISTTAYTYMMWKPGKPVKIGGCNHINIKWLATRYTHKSKSCLLEEFVHIFSWDFHHHHSFVCILFCYQPCCKFEWGRTKAAKNKSQQSDTNHTFAMCITWAILLVVLDKYLPTYLLLLSDYFDGDRWRQSLNTL